MQNDCVACGDDYNYLRSKYHNFAFSILHFTFGESPREIPIWRYLGIVMVSTIWLSVSRRSDTAGMPESWIFCKL